MTTGGQGRQDRPRYPDTPEQYGQGAGQYPHGVAPQPYPPTAAHPPGGPGGPHQSNMSGQQFRQATPHQLGAPHQQQPGPVPQPYQQGAAQLPSHQMRQQEPEPPLTLPGWGAIPAVLGSVVAIVGLFALKWVGDANFADLNDALNSSPDLKGDEQWLKLYLRQGAIIALALSAVPPVMWTLGSLRNRESIKRRGGLMKKSLSTGNTTPTRILITAIAGAALLYHVVSLLLFTDSGKHLNQLGAGPWLLVVGAALLVAGAAIGPRIPRR